MENQEMQMPAAMPQVMPPQGMPSPMPQEAMAPGPDQMAIFEQMRREISPQEFSNEMFAGAAQADPAAVSELMRELDEMDPSPEELDMLNDMVDAVLANPENYPQLRQKYLSQGMPEEILPEQFDPQFFAGLNMAVDQLIAAPSGVQAFALGGIAELKPIVKAIAGYGRNGDTMLAHITPAEARMLRRRGGSGTINPITGLPEFFKKFFKKVGQAVKKFANSTVGKIVTTVALGFFLGPAAASFLGVSSAVGVAAVSGFVGSAGSTALGGGSLKDSLKAGVVGAVTAGAGAGITGGADAFASGSYTGPTTVGAQVDRFKSAIGLSPTGMAPVTPPVTPPVSDPLVPDPAASPAATAAPAAPVAPAVAAAPAASPDPLGDFINQDAQAKTLAGTPAVARAPVPVAAPAGSTPTDLRLASGAQTSPLNAPRSFLDQGMDFFKQNISPSGIREAGIPGAQTAGAEAIEKLVARVPDATAAMKEAAYQSAFKASMPGVFSTYAPAVGVGLGVMGLAGGFETKKIPESQLAKDLKETATDRMRRENTQRLNYLQNLPGVVYDQFGQPVSGSYNPFPIYTPQGAEPPVAQAGGEGLPDIGSMPSPFQPYQPQLFQPYNTAQAYTNLMPRTRMAQGGIAGLAAGGYPRRTGQISGPGTEKSDSIPAMLSDGEFVMTASAVRGAGKGSRREGAKRMYKLMHQLEKNSERG